MFTRSNVFRRWEPADALRNAFTLVELLVVIAIIGVLAALLFPTLSTAKKKAQGTYCLSNSKQLIAAVHLYAGDHNDWLPPNPEHSTPVAWVKGTMRIAAEATNTLYLTDPRFAKLASYTASAASLYHCPADKSTVTIQGSQYPRVRSFSMSQAVGTEAIPPLRAVDGIWLNGNHDHKANNPWRTYGKFADMVAPTPAGLWVLVDEDESSINDAGFAVAMDLPTRWVDWPGTYHNLACGIAFADAHAEIHKWTDPRTRVIGGDVKPRSQPDSRDILWLQKRTSSNVLTGEPK